MKNLEPYGVYGENMLSSQKPIKDLYILNVYMNHLMLKYTLHRFIFV